MRCVVLDARREMSRSAYVLPAEAGSHTPDVQDR